MCHSDEDKKIIQRVKNGDGSAETELIRKYQIYVFRIFYHVLKNPEDAEDGSQELWIYLLVHILLLKHSVRRY